MQNWKKFPRVIFLTLLVIGLCAGLVVPRLGEVQASPLQQASPVADLFLTMAVPASDLFPNVGDTVAFTIKVKNNGPDIATGVTVKDVLPAGLTYKSDDGGGTYDSSTGIWAAGSLGIGVTAQFKITATVILTGPKTNLAEVWHSDQTDPDSIPGNGLPIPPIIEDDYATVVINPLISDLSLTQTFTNSTPNNFIFTLTVNNAGINPATNVIVKDLLPVGLTYVSDDGGGSYNNITGIWAVGSLLASGSGSSDTLKITAKATTSGAKTNIAEVWTSDQFDPDSTPGNGITTEDDYASTSVTPNVADLSITKTIDNLAPIAGDPVKFTITVANAGPNDATGVTVKDMLPADFAYGSSSGAGTYNNISGIWTVGTIVNGSSATLTINATALTSGVKTNWAEVWTSDQIDPDSIPGDSSKTTDDDDGAPYADLSLTKTVDKATVSVGANFVFTVTVSNAGPGNAKGVVIKDLLPLGLTYVSDTGSGTYNNTTGLWTVGSLTNGANAVLKITANASANGTMTNSAEVWSSDQFDFDSIPADSLSTSDDYASVTVSSAFPAMTVLINEVAWGGTLASSSDEWIELYNPSSFPISLAGWQLNASDGSPVIALNSITLGPGQYYILATGSTIFSDVTVDQTFTGSLANEGEILRLYDSSNTVVDTANSDGGSWPAGSGSPSYASMERIGKYIDSSSTWATFASSAVIAHDKNGNAIKGTPKKSNWAITVTLTPTPSPTTTRTPTTTPTRTPIPTSTYIPAVGRPIINEFLARPGFDWNQDGKVDVFDEFVEIRNIGNADISLSGWVLDDEANQGSSPFTLPDITLKVGQRMVFYGKQTNILLGDGGDTVRLIHPNGKIYDAYTYAIAKVEDQSICRLIDGSGSWYEDCVPTPSLTNSREGVAPSMPDGKAFESPVCDLPDTLPADFLFAECRGYGANIWHSFYWDQFGWQGDQYIQANMSKWETFVE